MFNETVLFLAMAFTALASVFGIKLYMVAEKHKTLAGKLKAIADYIDKNQKVDLELLTLLSELLSAMGYGNVGQSLIYSVLQEKAKEAATKAVQTPVTK